MIDETAYGPPHGRATTVVLPVDTIKADSEHFRFAEDHSARVASLAKAIKEGATLPAVWLVAWGEDLYLVDGHHRLAAHKSLGKAEIAAKVVDRGTFLAYYWDLSRRGRYSL